MAWQGPSANLPLAGLRIIELAGGHVDGCGRLLADLGAEVILVEPPGGLPQRRQPPLHQGVSLQFATHHSNKRSIVLDLQTDGGRDHFFRLLDGAGMLIVSLSPRTLDRLGLAPASLRSTRPGLVVLAASDYGQTGPWSDQTATHAVHAATSGFLCRSGLPGQDPLLPPGELLWEAAAIQAAWVALLGLWQRQQTGVGDCLDFSVQEGAAQALDPALGVTGSAAAGRSALDSTPHGRPPAQPLYPVIPCRDGLVRICVLNPRQWEAMRDWLGSDHEFCDPMYSNIAKRMTVAPALNERIGQLFAQYDAAQLLDEGQRRGVPIAVLQTPQQVLEDPHFRARSAFLTAEIAPGVVGAVPSGLIELDDQRLGWRQPAPALDQDGAGLRAELDAMPQVQAAPVPEPVLERRPLSGLRVLDLGVIVAGAEASRLLADQGADVIKVENKAFADGGRQSMTGDPMTTSIAQGHRNKRSLGLNLRSEEGREMFKQLAAQSDVILSNFKPGTLESLGLGYEVLSSINPRIVMMCSSALGHTGPMAKSLGYGPLVRAATGMSFLWRYPDQPRGFADGVTIFPDHLAGRVAGVGVLAALMRRERTGRGGQVFVSQAEIFLNANATGFLRESLQPGSFTARGNSLEFTAPDGVFRCAGEDEWCAVSVRNDADWLNLCKVMGRHDLANEARLSTVDGRIAHRAEVNAAVAGWTAGHSPDEVQLALQDEGVPAGKMVRLSEFRSHPHLAARRFIGTLTHPGLAAPLPTENMPALSLHMPEPELRPAPYQAEHTRELAASLLGLLPARVSALIASGDLEDMAPLPAPKLQTTDTPRA